MTGDVHLTPQLIQAVRDAVDIVTLASDHTRLRKAGRQYVGLCPVHREKTPSFQVDPAKGLFYCFGCGAGGDAIRLHMLVTGDDFPATIEALAQRYGIPLPARGSQRGDDEPDIHRALTAAAEFFSDSLKRHALPRQYLEQRRVDPELARLFELGYAPPSWDDLLRALSGRISLRDLEAAGLVARSERSGKAYDRFRNRLIFPIRSPAGRLVGFGGRTLGDDRAKYINSSETESFHKSRLLYGLYEARRSLREGHGAVLTEGYLDVLAVRACGFETAVASMGTSLTQEQVKLLTRYTDEVVVAYDGDSAGDAASRRALPLLLEGGLAVRRAAFGEGHDPDSLRIEAGEEAVRRAIDGAEDAVLLELGTLIPQLPEQNPYRRAEIATAVAEILRPIPDSIVRSAYARRAADRLGVPEQQLWKRSQGRAQPRGAPPPRAGPSAAPAPAPRLTRSLEEDVLRRLLLRTQEAPSLRELPAPEVFFEGQCRSLYRGYLEAYRRLGRAPDPGVVRDGLEAGSETLARLASILRDEETQTSTALSFGIRELLARLVRRWLEQRQKEITGALREAQRQGDDALLARLLEEKQALSQSLHQKDAPPFPSGE